MPHHWLGRTVLLIGALLILGDRVKCISIYLISFVSQYSQRWPPGQRVQLIRNIVVTQQAEGRGAHRVAVKVWRQTCHVATADDEGTWALPAQYFTHPFAAQLHPPPDLAAPCCHAWEPEDNSDDEGSK